MIISMGNGQPGQITKDRVQQSGIAMEIMFILELMAEYSSKVPAHTKMKMIQ